MQFGPRQDIRDFIDSEFARRHAEEQDEFRHHLGGSIIGRKCDREKWYSFRWVGYKQFGGRMLRLFNRGHREEFRFVEYLRSIGAEVREYAQQLWVNEATGEYVAREWDEDVSGGTGQFVPVNTEHHYRCAEEQGVHLRQWRILDVSGHFGGSLDGMARGAEFMARFGITLDEILLEFKTHNTKSFLKLSTEKCVQITKPEHWAQMQVYMHKRGLKAALYVAVNKNDDDLYIELVPYVPEEGPKLLANAEAIIHAKTPPPRKWASPAQFECKYCDFYKQCHYAEPLLRHCRTCANATPVEDGQWHCSRWAAIIPSDAQIKGCDSYQAITD